MTLAALSFDKRGIAHTFINGPAGKLEAIISKPSEITDTTPLIVISHPHPLYGGTMTNKVVHILAKTFSEMAITVRFNFRGVGQSEGEFAQGIGESEDLLAVVEEVQKWHPAGPLWLAGFSFGAYVSWRVLPGTAAEKLLLVAPPVSMYPFEEKPEITIPWVVIQGGQDEVIDSQAVQQWLDRQNSAPVVIWMEEAGHFFHGRLNDIREKLIEAWG